MASQSIQGTAKSEQDEENHHNDQVFIGMICVFAEACVL